MTGSFLKSAVKCQFVEPWLTLVAADRPRGGFVNARGRARFSCSLCLRCLLTKPGCSSCFPSLSHLNLCDSAQASINLLIFFLCLAVGGFRRPAASDKSEGQACFRYLAWGTSLAVGTSLPGPSQQLVTK